MSDFKVNIETISNINSIPGDDSIEVAQVKGYQVVVKKGEFSIGEEVLYIPQGACLPKYILEELGFWDNENNKGKLNGPEHNRIDPLKLRGVLSEGICAKLKHKKGIKQTCFGVEVSKKEDYNNAEKLGIKKFEYPPITGNNKEVFHVQHSDMVSFDVNRLKDYPDILDGHNVVITEKIHGTFVGITISNNSFEFGFGPNKNVLIYSKGMLKERLSFKNVEENKDNLYVIYGLKILEHVIREGASPDTNVSYFGEVYGPKIQDLTYGEKNDYRIFGKAEWVKESEVTYYNAGMLLHSRIPLSKLVPLLYVGPFDTNVISELTNQNTVVGSNHNQIREGVVIGICHPSDNRNNVFLKSVSEKYLFRKNGTEFN